MTTEERYRAILRNHLPEQAVGWVYEYLERHKVHFHITRERRSKLGDYRWPQSRHPFHEMSVNGDLPKLMFLWVFLHEAAHLETHLKYRSVQPHGHEWQYEYVRLIADHRDCFPNEVRPMLDRYVARVPLQRSLGHEIEKALRHHGSDIQSVVAMCLDDLPAGSRFRLKTKSEVLFESIERRRTRWLCRDVDSSRKYAVAGRAEVTECP